MNGDARTQGKDSESLLAADPPSLEVVSSLLAVSTCSCLVPRLRVVLRESVCHGAGRVTLGLIFMHGLGGEGPGGGRA